MHGKIVRTYLGNKVFGKIGRYNKKGGLLEFEQ